MALITRVARLFRADLHAVLDRVEEPDILLRQAVRDMEDELAHDQQRARLLTHEQDQLDTRVRELEVSMQDIAEQLEVCFAADKDELARTLIRRSLEAQRCKQYLEKKRVTLEDTVATLRARVDEQQTQLESMRQKAELLTDDAPSEQAADDWSNPGFEVRDEDVEVAFLREKQRRRGS